MSPDAPGRIAYTGRGDAPGYPELMKTSPCRANGVGVTLTVMPESSQRSRPSKSYDRTLRRPAVTISVRRSFSHTNGVDQFSASSRLTRQISLPVFLSYAAMNDSVALS